MNHAVADAGPLIHLTEVGCLSLLRIFDRLSIPDAVWSEAVTLGSVPQTDMLALGIVQRHALSHSLVIQFIQQNSLERLHAGEQECLFLCQQSGVSVLLTDDLAVREAAKRLRLTPVGSLGIIVRAYRLGHLSLTDAERRLNDLDAISSLFVTRAIVELAIKQLHKH
jgi:predicted nucleic acid-binding protein